VPYTTPGADSARLTVFWFFFSKQEQVFLRALPRTAPADTITF